MLPNIWGLLYNHLTVYVMLLLINIINAGGPDKDGKTGKIGISLIPISTNKAKLATNSFPERENIRDNGNDRATSHTVSSWAKVTDVAKLKKMLYDKQETISYLLEECDAKGKKLDHSNKEQWVQKIIQSAKQMRQSENNAKAEEKNGNCENKIQKMEQKLKELEKENQNLKKELGTFKDANKFEIAGYEMNEFQMLFLDIGAANISMDQYSYSIKELTPEMPDYKTITTYIANSSYATDNNCSFDVDIVKIFVLHYKKEGKVHFVDNKPSDQNRRLLFHGTSVQSAKTILKNIRQDQNGYDIKEGVAGKFGKGIYFADRMCFAAEHAFKNEHPNGVANGIIFLNEVALGKQFMHKDIYMDYDATTYANIPENADSIFAQGTKIPEPGVEGVLNDGTVVPYGTTKVIDYSAGSVMLADYNEYIVYKASQAKIRYFIYAKIKPVEA